MKTYWDSSALILALHDQEIRSRIEPSENATRQHSLAEIFCTLTKGVNFRYPAVDAANMIEDLARDLSFVELSRGDTLEAIKAASAQGVRGARIHDLMHAHAAKNYGAGVLKTLDDAGFSTLKISASVERP
jgi:predicted nucleic acid-binding protein